LFSSTQLCASKNSILQGKGSRLLGLRVRIGDGRIKCSHIECLFKLS
jgi:hypothetical protein